MKIMTERACDLFTLNRDRVHKEGIRGKVPKVISEEEKSR